MSTGTLQSLLAAFDPELPLERAKTIPNTWYTDPPVYAAERDAVFGGPGRWSAGRNRSRAGGVPHRRHRRRAGAGGPRRGRRRCGRSSTSAGTGRRRSCTEACGTATKLRCRYHGWTYDLAGNLRGTPEFDGVRDFRKEDNGLVAGARSPSGGRSSGCTWTSRANPWRRSWVRYPRGCESRTAFDGLTWYARRKSYDLACNWKVYVDNYLDGGYHVNTVHPGLAGVLDYREYRRRATATRAAEQPDEAGRGDARARPGPATWRRTGGCTRTSC